MGVRSGINVAGGPHLNHGCPRLKEITLSTRFLQHAIKGRSKSRIKTYSFKHLTKTVTSLKKKVFGLLFAELRTLNIELSILHPMFNVFFWLIRDIELKFGIFS